MVRFLKFQVFNDLDILPHTFTQERMISMNKLNKLNYLFFRVDKKVKKQSPVLTVKGIKSKVRTLNLT